MATEGTPSVGTRMRRISASLLATFALTAGVVVAATTTASAADPPPTNVGVTMTGAFTGVTNGLNQVLSVHAYATNVGNPLSVTLTLNTGGRVTAQGQVPLPANCTNNTSGSADVVTCTWDGFLLSQTPQGGDFKVVVKTPAAPATSMTSTATISGTLGTVPLVDDSSDNTATVITTLSTLAPCGGTCTQGFVPNGGSISRTSADGTIIQKLSVPANANWTGGGMYVTLDERSTAAFTCAGQPCSPQMGEALFTPFNPGAQPKATDPAIKEEISYAIQNVCNGTGNSTCFPLYYTVTGQNAGVAPQAPSCPQPAGGVIYDTSGNPLIPCVAATLKGTISSLPASNSVTYIVAMLKDIGLPPLLPRK